MLPKTPKSRIWKYFKGTAKTLFVIEAVCFAASYGVYYRMNTNREFRNFIQEKAPFVLDYYYRVGELLGDSNLRQVDAAVWRSEEESQQKR